MNDANLKSNSTITVVTRWFLPNRALEFLEEQEDSGEKLIPKRYEKRPKN